MAIYRFRVCLEENEDIYRDIDIKASQNFEMFHEAIQEAFKFDKKHAASFFTSDDYWRKGEEITLRKEDLALNEDDIRNKIAKKHLMKEVKIAKFIEQPHQRFVYVFDPEVQWTFLIEMLKIANEDPKVNYPVCVRTGGKAPRQYKQVTPPQEELNPELALAYLLKAGDDFNDDEAYSAVENDEGIEDEDLNSLEGEEGEEEESDEFENDEFGGGDSDGFSEFNEED
ncbi:MAG: hypothetical protein AB7O73_00490 [Bacteroidia bacterium]